MSSPVSQNSFGPLSGMMQGSTTPVTAVETTQLKTVSLGQQTPPIQKDLSRCWTCNKGVGFIGIKCRCDYIFCVVHQSQHGCTFNYKAEHAKEISKNNPVVRGSKVVRF